MGIFLFNDRTSDEFGIYTAEKDIHSAPARDQSLISVPGRNGDIIIDNGRYENVNVSFTCYCKDLVNDMDGIKAWLCQPGYHQLQDGYNPLYIRQAAFATNLKVDELINNVGKFTLTFNCKPFRTFISGAFTKTFTKAGTLNNMFLFNALPYIKITGSGAITLNINSRAYSFSSVPTYLEIDSELMSCYKGNALHNDKIKFTEFPYLEPGDNNISWTGNVSKVEIIPRWMTL